MRSDVRGFAFGLTLGLAALAGFGAAQIGAGQEGRYQVAAGEANGSRCVYVLDSRKCRLYERVGDGDFKHVHTPLAE